MGVVNSFWASVIEVVNILLNLYVWVLIIGAVLSWLVVFDVVNSRNKVVQVVGDFCFRITEPALKQIRRVIHPFNGVDLAPLVLIFIIMFIQHFLTHLAYQI